MQGPYTVSTQPVQARTYPNKHGGNLTVWRLGLQEAQSEAVDGLFELHKKEGNEPPRVGDRIEVERSQQGDFSGEPFVRLFTVYGGQQGGGSSPASGKDDYARRSEHPRNEARMIHTSALSAAPVYIEQLLTLSRVPQPQSEDEYWALVTRVANRLARSYQGALSGTEQAPVSQPQLNGGEVPADMAGLTPAPAGVDDDVPF